MNSKLKSNIQNQLNNQNGLISNRSIKLIKKNNSNFKEEEGKINLKPKTYNRIENLNLKKNR